MWTLGKVAKLDNWPLRTCVNWRNGHLDTSRTCWAQGTCDHFEKWAPVQLCTKDMWALGTCGHWAYGQLGAYGQLEPCDDLGIQTMQAKCTKYIVFDTNNTGYLSITSNYWFVSVNFTSNKALSRDKELHHLHIL